jgi:NAD(P)-dependent dehydrogenase (short-subunit alcohol dehydrogenase family)
MKLPNDFTNKAVLITGGTKGLGLSIGKAFARHGAHVWLTNRWGSADEDAIRASFAELGAPEPRIIEADASSDEDTDALLEELSKEHDGVEVLVSNVSFAQVNKDGLEGMRRRRLFKSLEYSSWPLVGYLQRIRERCGRYPRYTLNTSCDGPDTYYPGYDYVAVAKTVNETLTRYLAKHLWEEEEACVNTLRIRPVSTESLAATFGDEFEPFLKHWHGDDYFVSLDAVGDAALAMCSGLLDAMTGQTLLLDRGVAFQDNMMRLFEQRARYGLENVPGSTADDDSA